MNQIDLITENNEVLPKAIHEGLVSIGPQRELLCAVLEDGTRLLSMTAVYKALGRSIRSKVNVGNRVISMPSFMDAQNLQPFVNDEVKAVINPINYIGKDGKQRTGFNALLLPYVCDVYLEARQAGVLTQKQQPVAKLAEILVRSLSKVSIIALVDEATGYQEVRPRDALQRYLDAFLLNEYAKWAKRFPDEFFENIFKMKGWSWVDAVSAKKPQVVGKYINNIVYERLAPKILEELKLRNPPNEKGNRKVKHHQYLTPDIGHPKLQEHLFGVMAIQRVANGNWKRFLNMLDLAYPRYGHTIPIALEDTTKEQDQNQADQPMQLSLFDQMLGGLTNVPSPRKENQSEKTDKEVIKEDLEEGK